MASVLFSTVGQAVGGPLGVAVGAVVGNTVDSALSGSGGGRASGIFLQRSAYGDVLPRIYGRTRTAGQLIWALPMEGAAGKGQGRRNAGASFAIALSSGPIDRIGRIWADGREIRASSGAFESPTIMRVHDGKPGQTVDPLILSAEGPDGTPDYRGMAYVVFENMPVAVFGNRIPNLSFEIFADEGPVEAWMGDILAATDITVDTSQPVPNLTGYSAFGNGVEEVTRLSRLLGMGLSFEQGRVRYTSDSRSTELGWDDLLAGDALQPELQQRNRPVGVAFTYLDPEREYQAGCQHVERGREGAKIESEAPVCVTAATAISIAGRMLRQAEAGSEIIRFAVSWRWLELSVGDRVTIGGRGPWRIIEREVRGFEIYCQAERVADSFAREIVMGDSGRSLAMPMIPPGQTNIRLFEVPVSVNGGDPALYAALSGGPGWRGASAELLVGGDGRHLGDVMAVQAWGELLQPLTVGPTLCWDQKNTLLLAVDPRLPVFEARTREDVLNGANILLAGNELIQFCDVEIVSEGVVRLSDLLRGRFGTDRFMQNLEAGTRVQKISADQLLKIEISADDIGRDFMILASGRGDPPGGTEAMVTLQGVGVGRMAPVHLQAERLQNGTIQSRWFPRDAGLWSWSSVDHAEHKWIWKFQSESGQAVVIPTMESELNIEAAEQIDRLGDVFGPGKIIVEAVGAGPVDFRTSYIDLA